MATLDWAHPLIRHWFNDKFGSATEPQRAGWPKILAGHHTLISAPTGSGKTFAAFLVCIDQLVRKALAHSLEPQTQILYVSPLKALSNDIQKNLMQPLSEIAELAVKQGLSLAPIHVFLRTGDTLASERQRMLKKPPHILITTPESLYILLTAEKSRLLLANVATVIVDEIHALVADKRGAHLALTLARLDALCGSPPKRIGLSATQKPLSLVADFLVGNNKVKPTIIDIKPTKPLDIRIEIPNSELSAITSYEMWEEIYDHLAKIACLHRSTLIFVNTRRLAERIAHHLSARLGEEKVAAHHGSLSRQLRLQTETKLKNGELSALVATASLELGIDIGTIDIVCQIGSPRAIAVALQRIGRAGHRHSAISKGRLFATTRDELLECAALVQAIRDGDLDQLILPEQPIDILSQQIVAACATEDWHEDQLFHLCKTSYPYRDLSRELFDQVIAMLSDGIIGSRGRHSAYLFYDRVNGVLKARRNSRLTAILNGGAIPENGLFTVMLQPDNIKIGTLDEEFAIESHRGDIILLGTTSWQVKRIESNAALIIVEDARGAPPSVPFWQGEAPARTKELSAYVSSLRKTINDLSQKNNKDAMTWLKKKSGVNTTAASQLISYLETGKTLLGAIPTQETIIAERFFDESGGMQLIIHAPLGAKINKAWGLALRKCFCRSFNVELQAAATDNGLSIALTEQHSFSLAEVFYFLHPHTIEAVLTQAILQSPLFATRWRRVATRALALNRFRSGKKLPPHIQRMQSEDLLAAVFPDAVACQDNLAGQDIVLPQHPLIQETMKEIFNEVLDLAGLTTLLKSIHEGTITCIAIDTPTPSVFSHEILSANPYAYLDDAPLEERRTRAVEMRHILPTTILQQVGKLDETAILEVMQEAWPDIRQADELHDALQTFIVLPIDTALNEQQKVFPEWHTFFLTLKNEHRVNCASYQNKTFWFAVEKTHTFLTLYPEAQIHHSFPSFEKMQTTREDALLSLLRGWLLYTGPVTIAELTTLFALPQLEIQSNLLKLEASGLILRGQFRPHSLSNEEWCERRLLARIQRRTLTRLRKEIAPVTTVQFIKWLFSWQHLAAPTKLRGKQGLLEIIKQLQGFELPANAWEQHIFAKRLVDYDPDLLDQLCLSGIVGWGRFAIPLKTNKHHEKKSKRFAPTQTSPITFFIRGTSTWIPERNPPCDELTISELSHIAQSVHDYLKQNGASFFTDIMQSVPHLKSEIETALWELVTAGLVTADAFDNLRALINPRRRLLKKRRRLPLFNNQLNNGRWSLLSSQRKTLDPAKQIETICFMLLNRYGVVFRDLLAQEKNIPCWRDLLLTFRLLEERGEIRGGRFVSGPFGEQFALPYAVSSLRAMRKQISLQEKVISVSAVDPLNLTGILLPGPRIRAISGKLVILTLQNDGNESQLNKSNFMLP